MAACISMPDRKAKPVSFTSSSIFEMSDGKASRVFIREGSQEHRFGTISARLILRDFLLEIETPIVSFLKVQ